MKLSKKKTIGLSLLVVAVVGLAIWLLWGPTPVNKVTFADTKIEKGTICNSITATGTIEPITQVEVGTQVSGIINKIYVDYNSTVKKGQLLAELDRVNLQNALQSSQSNMRLAKDRLEYQHKEYLRIKGLHEKDLSSTQSLDEALYNYRTAVSNYATAKLDYEKARTNLGYAMIYSPIDGVVLSKEVEEGQTVAASMSTPTLFKIAQDLKQMQVVADIDEADIGEVRKGQRVSFTVDAYPDESFEGEVTQVRQEATTTNNVVTYEVVIKANNESLKLKPGLTANVTIYTLEKSNILVVANKALRFTPDSALIGSEDVVQRTAGIKEDETHKILWVRQGKVFKAIPVQVGITNGTLTEIVSGISAGQKVILEATAGMMPGNDATSTSSSSKTTSSSTESSPFMPKRPGQNKTK